MTAAPVQKVAVFRKTKMYVYNSVTLRSKQGYHPFGVFIFLLQYTKLWEHRGLD